MKKYAKIIEYKIINIKIFTQICSFKGYCYQMIPYIGKRLIYNINKILGEFIVEILTRDHKNTNIDITLDNYFINIFAILYFYHNKIYLTWT